MKTLESSIVDVKKLIEDSLLESLAMPPTLRKPPPKVMPEGLQAQVRQRRKFYQLQHGGALHIDIQCHHIQGRSGVTLQLVCETRRNLSETV